MDSTFPATTPTSTSTAPPANDPSRSGTSTANDMIAAAMIRMIDRAPGGDAVTVVVVVLAHTVNFLAGVLGPGGSPSILSGRGVRAHIGRVTSGAQLVPVARDPLAAGTRRRRPPHPRAPRSVGTGHPSDACRPPHRPGRAVRPGRRCRATQGQAVGSATVSTEPVRPTRAAATGPSTALGVEQHAHGEGGRDGDAQGVRHDGDEPGDPPGRHDRDGGRPDGEGDGGQARCDLGTGGADRVAPSTASSTAPVTQGRKALTRRRPRADEREQDDDALGRQPAHVTVRIAPAVATARSAAAALFSHSSNSRRGHRVGDDAGAGLHVGDAVLRRRRCGWRWPCRGRRRSRSSRPRRRRRPRRAGS